MLRHVPPGFRVFSGSWERKVKCRPHPTVSQPSTTPARSSSWCSLPSLSGEPASRTHPLPSELLLPSSRAHHLQIRAPLVKTGCHCATLDRSGVTWWENDDRPWGDFGSQSGSLTWQPSALRITPGLQRPHALSSPVTRELKQSGLSSQ